MADDIQLEGLDGEGTGVLAGMSDGSVRFVRDSVANEPSILNGGGAGHDLLIGGAGRDLLIGGEAPRAFDPADFFILGDETSGESSDYKEWIDVPSMSWGTGGASAGASPTTGSHYTQMLWDDTIANAGDTGDGVPIISVSFSFEGPTWRGDGLGAGEVSVADVIIPESDVQPDGFVWGLDRVDQDAGSPGGVFVAAVDFDGAISQVFAFDLM